MWGFAVAENCCHILYASNFAWLLRHSHVLICQNDAVSLFNKAHNNYVYSVGKSHDNTKDTAYFLLEIKLFLYAHYSMCRFLSDGETRLLMKMLLKALGSIRYEEWGALLIKSWDVATVLTYRGGKCSWPPRLFTPTKASIFRNTLFTCMIILLNTNKHFTLL